MPLPQRRPPTQIHHLSWSFILQKEVTIKKYKAFFSINNNLLLYLAIPIDRPQPRVKKDNNDESLSNQITK